MIESGSWFAIQHKRHFGYGHVYQCRRVEAVQVKGFDGTILDLGRMVAFWVEFADPGKPGLHAVPEEWCVPCEPPRVPVGRIKSARIPSAAPPTDDSEQPTPARRIPPWALALTLAPNG
jgi:hypothetical protein